VLCSHELQQPDVGEADYMEVIYRKTAKPSRRARASGQSFPLTNDAVEQRSRATAALRPGLPASSDDALGLRRQEPEELGRDIATTSPKANPRYR